MVTVLESRNSIVGRVTRSGDHAREFEGVRPANIFLHICTTRFMAVIVAFFHFSQLPKAGPRVYST